MEGLEGKRGGGGWPCYSGSVNRGKSLTFPPVTNIYNEQLPPIVKYIVMRFQNLPEHCDLIGLEGIM